MLIKETQNYKTKLLSRPKLEEGPTICVMEFY